MHANKVLLKIIKFISVKWMFLSKVTDDLVKTYDFILFSVLPQSYKILFQGQTIKSKYRYI